MKKKILITLAIVTTLAIGAIGFALFKLNDIVAELRPSIEQQLSTVLGAKVQLGEISASVFPTARLSVKETTVLAADAKTPLISLGGLSASVALRPLLSRRLEVSALEITQPRLTLVKDAGGTRVEGMSLDKPQAAAPLKPSQESAQPSPPQKALDIKISRITISEGEVTLDDRLSNRRIPIRAINLDAGIELQGSTIQVPTLTLSLSPANLPALKLSARQISFAKDSGNISIESLDAKADPGSLHAEGTFSTTSNSGKLTVSSTGIDLNKLAGLLKQEAPSLSAMNLSGSISTALTVTLVGNAPPSVKGPVVLKSINADLASAQKLRGLSGEIDIDGSLTDLSISAAALNLSLQEKPLVVTTTARVTQHDVTIQSLTVKGLGGEARLPASLQLAPQKGFSAHPELTIISISELLHIAKPPLADVISGIIVAFKGNFSGPLTGAIAQSVSGSGELVVKDGTLKGVNLPNLVLSKISGIPLLEGTLRSHIATEHQQYFADTDTNVKELQAHFSIADGIIQIKSLYATGDAFSITASGTVSMDGELYLQSTFTLSTEISKSLAQQSKTVSAILNTATQLEIPVLITGKSPLLIVLPDISKLIAGAGGKFLEEKAGALLDKALGGKGGGKGKKNPLGGLLGF